MEFVIIDTGLVGWSLGFGTVKARVRVMRRVRQIGVRG